jgi:hypothetical protein
MIINFHGYRKERNLLVNALFGKLATKVAFGPFDLGWQKFAFKTIKCLANMYFINFGILKLGG